MTDFPEPGRCRTCGEPIPEEARFCPSCGASLSPSSPPPTNVEPGPAKPASDIRDFEKGGSAPRLRPRGPLARLHAAIPLSRRVATAALAAVLAAGVAGALVATRGNSTSPTSLKITATSPPSIAPPATTATSTAPTTNPPITSAALPQVYAKGCPGDYPATLEPTEIPLACADYNLRLTELTWSSWTAASANGNGTLMQNDCTPDCAGGTFHSYPTTVTLDDPLPSRTQGLVFATVTWISPTGSTQSEPIGPDRCSNDPYALDC